MQSGLINPFVASSNPGRQGICSEEAGSSGKIRVVDLGQPISSSINDAVTSHRVCNIIDLV